MTVKCRGKTKQQEASQYLLLLFIQLYRDILLSFAYRYFDFTIVEIRRFGFVCFKNIAGLFTSFLDNVTVQWSTIQ